MSFENLACPKNNVQLGLIYSFKNKTLKASLWAAKALMVKICIYKATPNKDFIKENLQESEIFTFQLKKNKKTGVWQKNWNEKTLLKDFNTTDLSGWFYEYLVTNEINGESESKNCLDPYAFSMAEYKNDGKNCMAAIIDFEDTRFLPNIENIESAKIGEPAEVATNFQFAEIFKNGESAENFQNGEATATAQNTATAEPAQNASNFQTKDKLNKSKVIIYEVSVRDFTISPNAKTKQLPGTYLAFTEKIPYLKKLGVTHIQLMPVLNFYNNDESKKDFASKHENCNYNWGYDPHNYFSPEGWFSLNSKNPYSRIAELQSLIHALHAAGLKVILDVVYNHMASVEFLENIVPNYYFRQNQDGTFIGNSGCGNDTASERTMVKKLIIDSLVHWVKNYDVDGFRFDLMGLIESSVILDGLKACEKVKKNLLFIGEGWKMYSGKTGVGLDQNYMQKTDKVSVFNDEFRDLIKGGGMNEFAKGFATNANVDLEQLFYNLTGRPQKNYTVCNSTNNVQYIAAHDGLTLHDNICLNCNLNEQDETQASEIYKRIKLSNFLLLTSQGIIFIHSGQEKGRTKLAVSQNSKNIAQFCFDSYNTADSVNAFDWNFSKNQQNLFYYMCSLIEFRKNCDIFSLGTIEKIEQCTKLCKDLCSNNLLIFCINYKKKNWFIIANASTNAQKIPLALKNAKVYVDTSGASLKPLPTPQGISIEKTSITVEGLSAFVISGKV